MADGPLPARIDRAQLERILARATELSAQERETGEPALSAEQVVALGREVGIPEAQLRQAMLEERTRVVLPAPDGVLDRVVGAGVVRAGRVVAGSVDEVQASLMKYLDTHEVLVVQRSQPGRVTWEPMGGVAGAIRRSSAALGAQKKPFLLGRAKLVGATIGAVEPGWCMVTLEADVRPVRAATVAGSSALAGTSLLASGIINVLSPFLLAALAPLPIGLGVGWLLLRSYRPQVERVALGLERALDWVEQQRGPGSGKALPPRSGLLDLLAEEVRRALKP